MALSAFDSCTKPIMALMITTPKMTDESTHSCKKKVTAPAAIRM